MKISLIDNLGFIQYHILGKIYFGNKVKIVPILIDTGASWSSISRDLCDNLHNLEKPKQAFGFEETLRTYTQYILMQIIFEKDFITKIKLMVSEDKNRILLGIDFLENFEYTISKEKLTLNGKEFSRIKLHPHTIQKIISEIN